MAEYGTVTELPGINAHKEQLERLVQRYVKGSKEILDNYFRICQCFVATGTPQEEIDEIIIQRGMVPFFR